MDIYVYMRHAIIELVSYAMLLDRIWQVCELHDTPTNLIAMNDTDYKVKVEYGF